MKQGCTWDALVRLVAFLSFVATLSGAASAAPVYRYAIGGSIDDGAVFAGYFDVDWNDLQVQNGGPLKSWTVTVTAGPEFDAHIYRSGMGDIELGRWWQAGCGGCYKVEFLSVYDLVGGGIDARVLQVIANLDSGFGIGPTSGGETSSANIVGCQTDPNTQGYEWRCLEGTVQRIPEPASSLSWLVGMGFLSVLSRRRKPN